MGVLGCLVACAAVPRVAEPAPGLVRAYAAPGPVGDRWGPFVREAAAEAGVPGAVLYAVMWAESRGCQWLNGKPISGVTGEAGLMQVPPAVYARFRRESRLPLGPDPWLPRDNIRFAAWSLSRFIRRYGLPDALAAYQAGPDVLEAARAGGALPAATDRYRREVWADAQARAARHAAGQRWTNPDRIVCVWTRPAGTAPVP